MSIISHLLADILKNIYNLFLYILYQNKYMKHMIIKQHLLLYKKN